MSAPDPAASGFRGEVPGALAAILTRAIAERVFPGAVAALGRRGRPAWLQAAGTLTYEPGAPLAGPDTVYDLSSLTKVVATTSIALQLAEQGRLDLGEPVHRRLPVFRGQGREVVTAAQLLSHSAGLPAWAPLFEGARGREEVVTRALHSPLEYAPGSRSVYSDLGFIVLGELLEQLAGERIDSLARARVLRPLDLRDTDYCPQASWRSRIAPTEDDPRRGGRLVGEVHDENAWAMGGVAAHAGLFGSAGDLARFAQALLDGGAGLFSAAGLARFARPAGVPGSSRALGWDTPSGRSTAGALSPRSFGHLGFTGTSLWIDPEREMYVILLSNRVHPRRPAEGTAIREIRRAVADAAVAALA